MNPPNTPETSPADPAAPTPPRKPAPEVAARNSFLFRLSAQTSAGAVLLRALERFQQQEPQP